MKIKLADNEGLSVVLSSGQAVVLPNAGGSIKTYESTKASLSADGYAAMSDIDELSSAVDNKATGVSIRYAVCDTAENIEKKVAVVADGKGAFSLEDGACVIVKFTNRNSATVKSPRLNVGDTGDIPIKRYGNTDMLASCWQNSEALEFIYDEAGQRWLLAKAVKADADQSGTVKISDSTSGDDSGTAVSQKAMSVVLHDQIEPLLFAQYYPDGSVKSAAEFTSGIKYDDPDTTNRTITVKPFCATDDSDNDNSSLVGRVVIPPFVDAQGNGYISDDGTRYKVVGVANGSLPLLQNKLTAIVAPNTVTNIGRNAFYDCSALTSVSLPAAQNIGRNAFYSCAALASVSLPAATTIGDSTFYSCAALASVSLPAATTIGDSTFEYCTALTSVSCPSAQSIGMYAFSVCTSLASVDFGDTPRSDVPSLGGDAFIDVPTSCKIIVPDAQYDAWIAATNWSTLYADGYKFLKHSEWEYARKYEFVSKSAIASLVQTVNNTTGSIDDKFAALMNGLTTLY